MTDFEYRAMYGSPEEEARTAETVVDYITYKRSFLLQQPGSLLDLFCGNGLFLQKFRSLKPSWKLYGVDSNSYILDEARRNAPDCNFTLAHGPPLPYGDHSFEIVFAKKIMDYADSREEKAEDSVRSRIFPVTFRFEELIKEVYKVLKPGGLYWPF